MVKLQTSAFDKLTCLALATKAVGLELNQRREGKGVVAGDEIHIFLADAGNAKESLATVVAGYVVNLRPRVVPSWAGGHGACCPAHDEDRRLAQVIRPLTRGDNQGCGHISLQ